MIYVVFPFTNGELFEMVQAKVLKIVLKLYLPTHWGCLKDSP